MKVGVIMGGVSSEYEVSMNSGREILKNLDPNKYEIIPIVITKREELIEQAKGSISHCLHFMELTARMVRFRERWRRWGFRIRAAGFCLAAFAWIKISPKAYALRRRQHSRLAMLGQHEGLFG